MSSIDHYIKLAEEVELSNPACDRKHLARFVAIRLWDEGEDDGTETVGEYHEALQKKMEVFGTKLTPELCKEFRDILQQFANIHYDLAHEYNHIGEAYKMAVIHLIPGKVQSNEHIGIGYSELLKDKQFTPATKQNKGNPLAELLHNLSEADKAKLVGSLETNLKKE